MIGVRPSPRTFDNAAAVPWLESGLLHEGDDGVDHPVDHPVEPRVVVLEAETGPVVVFDDHPAAGTQRGREALEDSSALGQMLEHQPGPET